MLIVDDAMIMRKRIRQIAEQSGWIVVAEAANGEEAIACYHEHTPDLVTLDIVMPKMDGVEVLEKTQKVKPEIPMLMISGHGDLDTAVQTMRMGAFDYISKPVNKETLLRFVRQALRHWELVQEKNRLQHENERFRRYLQVIFSSVSDAILTVDEEMNVIQFNRAASGWIYELENQHKAVNLSELSGDIAAACCRVQCWG